MNLLSNLLCGKLGLGAFFLFFCCCCCCDISSFWLVQDKLAQSKKHKLPRCEQKKMAEIHGNESVVNSIWFSGTDCLTIIPNMYCGTVWKLNSFTYNNSFEAHFDGKIEIHFERIFFFCSFILISDRTLCMHAENISCLLNIYIFFRWHGMAWHGKACHGMACHGICAVKFKSSWKKKVDERMREKKLVENTNSLKLRSIYVCVFKCSACDLFRVFDNRKSHRASRVNWSKHVRLHQW